VFVYLGGVELFLSLIFRSVKVIKQPFVSGSVTFTKDGGWMLILDKITGRNKCTLKLYLKDIDLYYLH
jgi:hypothetical protein